METSASRIALPIVRFAADASNETDVLTVEEPMEIRVAYFHDGIYTDHSLSVTMRTPGDDLDLAAGFLFSEGIVSDLSQIADIATVKPQSEQPEVPSNIVRATLTQSTPFDPESHLRHFYTTSSCGVCGKVALAAVNVHIQRSPSSDFTIEEHLLRELPDRLNSHQRDFAQTGGLHACGFFNDHAEIVRVREDVGRHNALDKLIGSFRDTDVSEMRKYGLVLSGRAGFELIQKAAMAGIGFIAALGPPSSLAVELAQEHDITLVGFLKHSGFNVYSNRHRIQDD